MRYLSLLFLVCCCCTQKQHKEPAPVIRPQPSALCDEACNKMALLGCAEAATVQLENDAGQITCVELCKQTTENGVPWNLDCLVEIVTCVDIEDTCNY